MFIFLLPNSLKTSKAYVPMKSKCMKKRREALHHDENDDGKEGPDGKGEEQYDAEDVLLLLGA